MSQVLGSHPDVYSCELKIIMISEGNLMILGVSRLTPRRQVHAVYRFFFFFFFFFSKIHYWVFKALPNSYQVHFLSNGTSH